MTRQKYKGWELFEMLPDGWKIDKTTGSPICGYVFITNGKSLISGKQKRALLHIDNKHDTAKKEDKKQHKTNKPNTNNPSTTKPVSIKNGEIDKTTALIFNKFARKKMIEKLLHDIMIDLTICDIEGWNKTEYLNDIKSSICSIEKKKKNTQNHKKYSLFDFEVSE